MKHYAGHFQHNQLPDQQYNNTHINQVPYTSINQYNPHVYSRHGNVALTNHPPPPPLQPSAASTLPIETFEE